MLAPSLWKIIVSVAARDPPAAAGCAFGVIGSGASWRQLRLRREDAHVLQNGAQLPRLDLPDQTDELAPLLFAHFLPRRLRLRMFGEVAADQPIHADLMLVAECNGIPGADALAHQLSNFGWRDRPFGRERLDASLHGGDGIRAIAVKAFTCLALADFRESGFRLLADFAHGRSSRSSLLAGGMPAARARRHCISSSSARSCGVGARGGKAGRYVSVTAWTGVISYGRLWVACYDAISLGHWISSSVVRVRAGCEVSALPRLATVLS
jgi:hypothetical protein